MNLELNVVRFNNEDVIATSADSHADCVTLTFTADNINGGAQENIHYHVSGATLTTTNKIKVGTNTYDLATSSKAGHSDPCIVNGTSWEVHNGADYADFAAGLTGHYVLDVDGVTYVKE